MKVKSQVSMDNNLDCHQACISLTNIVKSFKLYDSPRDRFKEALNPFGNKYHKDFYALKDINLSVNCGDVIGVIGKNGSGKSTLLKIIAGILQPTAGQMYVKGHINALIELGAGFNPDISGKENILFLATIMGYTQEEIEEKIQEIINFVNIGQFIEQPVRTYSNGMKSRLAFAIATAIKPDILILDEVLSVGDALFRRKAFSRMEKLIAGKTTVIFVSHDLSSIVDICDTAILMADGMIVNKADPKSIVEQYEKLLFSDQEKKAGISGSNVNAAKDASLLKNKMKINVQGHSVIEKSVANKVDSSSIKIDDVYILNEKGKITNNLYIYESYKLVFKVSSTACFENVFYTALIKTISGVRVSGKTSKSKFKINIYPGEVHEVVFSFKCILAPASYLIDVAVNSIDENGEHVQMERIYDGVIVNVIEGEKSYWGLVDVFEDIDIKK